MVLLVKVFWNLAGYMVLLVIYCGIGVSEGSWEGTCEANSAPCVSVRSETQKETHPCLLKHGSSFDQSMCDLQEGTSSVRFVSVPNFSTIHRFGSVRFGSVRFGKYIFPVRRGSACIFRTFRSSVRFGSVRFRVRFWPVPELHISVRFGSVWSVRCGFLFLHESLDVMHKM